MVGVLIRMKLAIIRNSMTGGKAAWMITGGVLGLIAAAATIWLSLVTVSKHGVVPDLLAAAYVVWLLGWMVGPVWGGSAVLRVDHFALLAVPRRKLAVGLLGAAFVGITTAVTALAFLSLVVYGFRLGVVPGLISIPAAALQLILVVLLSRAAYSVFGLVSQSRIGSAFTGTLLAALLVLTQSGWMLIVAIIYSKVLTTGFPSLFSTVVRAIPSGWGLIAVESAHDRQWLQTVGILLATAVLIGLLLLGWSRTLGTFRHGRATVRGTDHGSVPTRGLLAGRTAAVVRKELRTWRRDPLRIQTVTIVIGWALGTALLPLTFDSKALLPWAGPSMALMAATVACNSYSQDGTAIWLTLETGTEREDLRGRQWAYLLVFGPLTVAVSVIFTLWSGYSWAWPWVVALAPALLGSGVGLAAYASVIALVPGPDAHKRPDNPLEHADTTGQSNVLFWVGLLPAVPAATLVILGNALNNNVLLWAGCPVGVATGVFLGWWLGRLAVNRLRARAPEMLFLMRTGRNPKTGATAKTEISNSAGGLSVLCWIFGSLCFFPQGAMPVVVLSTGIKLRSWFFALYLPQPLRWPTAIVMLLLGLFLYTQAIRITARARAKAATNPVKADDDPATLPEAAREDQQLESI